MRKKIWRKSMLKFDAGKKTKIDSGVTFWIDLSCLRQYSRTGPQKRESAKSRLLSDCVLNGYRRITTEIVIKCMSKSSFSDPKPSKYHQIGTQNRCQNHEKSRWCRGCVFEAALGCQKGGASSIRHTHFGSHFRPKLEKRHPKRHAKINAEKVLKINAERLPK